MGRAEAPPFKRFTADQVLVSVLLAGGGATADTLASRRRVARAGTRIGDDDCQIAHGDVGARNLAMGYLAIVIPDPGTGNIAAGAIWVNTVQTISPGFQGYMFAVCNFQYAHGFAFISDVGARNLAMGYLAIVIPDPGTGTRNATPACPGISGCSTTGEQDAH